MGLDMGRDIADRNLKASGYVWKYRNQKPVLTEGKCKETQLKDCLHKILVMPGIEIDE